MRGVFETSTREPGMEHMNTIRLKSRLEGWLAASLSPWRFKVRIDSEGPDKAGLSPLWFISEIVK